MRSAGALALACMLAACNGGTPAAQPSDTASSAAAAADPAALPSAALVKRLQALGTEPFWSAEDRGRIIRYTTPDYVNWTPVAVDRREEGGRTTWTGTYRNMPFVLIVAPGNCSDGMSDTVYPMTSELTVKGEVRRGCARLR